MTAGSGEPSARRTREAAGCTRNPCTRRAAPPPRPAGGTPAGPGVPAGSGTGAVRPVDTQPATAVNGCPSLAARATPSGNCTGQRQAGPALRVDVAGAKAEDVVEAAIRDGDIQQPGLGRVAVPHLGEAAAPDRVSRHGSSSACSSSRSRIVTAGAAVMEASFGAIRLWRRATGMMYDS